MPVRSSATSVSTNCRWRTVDTGTYLPRAEAINSPPSFAIVPSTSTRRERAELTFANDGGELIASAKTPAIPRRRPHHRLIQDRRQNATVNDAFKSDVRCLGNKAHANDP